MQNPVLETSLSLCPVCFTKIPCTYEARGDEVWQTKQCPDHGGHESTVWHGLKHWEWTEGFNDACCEGSCDPAGDTDRKRCVAIVDVTQNCNLTCSYCFASSRPGLEETPVDTIHGLLETVLRESNGPTPIQLSGGEPTTREDLPEIVTHARGLGFSHIEINSNGLRLAEEPTLAVRLQEAGAKAIYLQFDGFGERVHQAIRDTGDLAPVKEQAIESCRQAGLQVILVPVVVPGVNDDQLGDILRFALCNKDTVRGVNFQPVSHFGRAAEDTGHLSLPAVAQLLADQSGFLQQQDLMQVPCCSPRCSSATMLLSTGTPENPRGVPLTRFISMDVYKQVFQELDEKRILDFLAGQKEGLEAGRDAALCCGIPVPPGVEHIAPRLLAVSITGFMDADNVDLARLSRCCINVPTPEGKLVPFCGYNLTDTQGRYRLREQYAREAHNGNGDKRRSGGKPINNDGSLRVIP